VLLPGGVKKQDIYILIFGIKQDSLKVSLTGQYQECWLSRSLFKKKARYFEVLLLIASKKHKTPFKILRNKKYQDSRKNFDPNYF
jgi:hypothetical protein